ncbi:MAG: hypothetical protein KatS3mg060_2879 [Dehalococcoidia bacterium]|nr:MAG: hypothetical protein KatS3mg060_2879 [Dehalococcoidia bacterium]
MSHWVICYDIADDRRRNQLRSLLKRYGDPVQESVFEARLRPAALRRLRSQVDSVVHPEEDRVAFYELASNEPAGSLVVA